MKKFDKIYQKLTLSKQFNKQALKLIESSSSTTGSFDRELANMADILIDRFGLYSRDIHKAICSKILGKEIDQKDGFGIRHYIDTSPYEDIDYCTASIMFEPGIERKELEAYIKKHFKTIKKQLNSRLKSSDLARIRARRFTTKERNDKIVSLDTEGYSDKEVSAILQLGGKLGVVRKAISDRKKLK